MKVVKVILGIVVALILAIVIVGQFLSSEQHVERSTLIDADQATVFALINDFREFNRWSPWAEKDPETEYEFMGPDTGVGSRMAWRSEDPNVGNGEQEIIESQAPTMVKTKLTFDGFDAPSYATFTIDETDDGTRVTWSFDANLDSLMGRYMGLMMESWVGTDYENGLARLKAVAEGDDSGSHDMDAMAHAGPTMNFHRIDSDLATGGHIVDDGVSELVDQGVTLVVDLRDEPPEGHGERLKEAGIRWINVPVVWDDPKLEDFNEFNQVMSENESQNVLVQCQANYRASAMTYAFRVKSGSASEEDARRDLEAIWAPEGQWETYISEILAAD